MSAAGGPRLLLRRLREIMAEQTSAQMRLDKLVAVIASNMVAEVCSIYLRRAGKVLELFATEGLARTAVHQTRLKEGEGLVGLVSETAEAVNLSDAPSDPHFSYRPETGEDPFKSFLGVPIVRGGQVFGVLTVQNQAERVYAEEEVEALQTVAMVLAEVVAQGGFFNVAELDEPELRSDRPRKFMGEGLSDGVAVGPGGAACPARQGRAHDRRQSGGRIAPPGRCHQRAAPVGGRDAVLQRARPDRRGPRGDRGLSPLRL
jgi:phosphotransferase system enzyme I (PtsP)